MSARYSKILFTATALFIVTILVGITASVVFTIGKSGTTAQAANISHYIVPIIFYPADVAPPSQTQIDALTNAYNAVRYWYALHTGQTFEYLPVRAYRGEQNKSYYLNSDNYICGSTKVMCNILNELAIHERSALRAYGSPDTSFGWWDRAAMIYTKDIPLIDNPPRSWAQSLPLDSRGGYSVLSSAVLDTLAHDFVACNAYADASNAEPYMRMHLCTDFTEMGVIAHELGHAIAGLPDAAVISSDDSCQYDLMCNGSFHFKDDPATSQDVNFNSTDLPRILNSPFTNPPEIGSGEWNSYLPPIPVRFCFESDYSNGWCYRTSPASGVPVPQWEGSLKATVSSGGDCNAFGCDGPSLNTSWSNVSYSVEYKCTSGPYCTDTWNQWDSCGTWPQGTCPPYTTTANSVNVLAVSGSSYKYRVWIITKKDGDINNVAAYPWVGETSVNNTCGGACSIQLTWSKATYDTNLTLNGVVEGGMPVNACRGNWVNPATGVASPCESAWSGTANSHTYTQLNTNTTLDQYVQVKDVNGTSHLLQSRQNIGTTANTCTGGFCQCSCSAAAVPGGTNSSLSGLPGSQNVTLSWSAPGSWGQECGGTGAREYLVKFDTVNPPSPAPLRTANLSLTLNALKPGTTYYWQVADQNKGGKISGYSAVQSFTTTLLPTPTPTPMPTPTPTPTPSPVDSDHDGFFDNVEAFVGTDPNKVCGLNAWPPDINGDGVVTKLDTDMFVPFIGKAVGSPGYNARYNLDMDGSISILDMSDVSGYLYSKCTNPVKTPRNGGLDPDGDGFKTGVEFYMGTDPNLVCGANAWPPDVDGDGSVTILDLTKIAQVFNSKIGEAKYNYRYDLNADTSINILDLSLVAQYFTSKCANPVKTSP